MTAELLAGIVMAILSLAFAYIPGVKTWYDGLSSQVKASIMGVMLIVVTLGVFGLACTGLGGDFGLTVTCDQAGAVELVKILLVALVANQSTYMLAVRPYKS